MSKQLRNCKDGADHRDNIHNQRAADRAEDAAEDIGLNRLHIGSYYEVFQTALYAADLEILNRATQLREAFLQIVGKQRRPDQVFRLLLIMRCGGIL